MNGVVPVCGRGRLDGNKLWLAYHTVQYKSGEESKKKKSQREDIGLIFTITWVLLVVFQNGRNYATLARNIIRSWTLSYVANLLKVFLSLYLVNRMKMQSVT
jgi:hypothetical protein